MADDYQAFDLCLRDEHSIERVSVVLRQELHRGSVFESYRQLQEAAVLDAFRERPRKPDPAQGRLDCDLPCRRGTHEDQRCIADRFARGGRELSVVLAPPEEHVGVEK